MLLVKAGRVSGLLPASYVGAFGSGYIGAVVIFKKAVPRNLACETRYGIACCFVDVRNAPWLCEHQ